MLRLIFQSEACTSAKGLLLHLARHAQAVWTAKHLHAAFLLRGGADEDLLVEHASVASWDALCVAAICDIVTFHIAVVVVLVVKFCHVPVIVIWRGCVRCTVILQARLTRFLRAAGHLWACLPR